MLYEAKYWVYRRGTFRFKGSQNWYKSINVTLDKRFSRIVSLIIKRISENPLLFPEKYRQIRVAVLNKFR